MSGRLAIACACHGDNLACSLARCSSALLSWSLALALSRVRPLCGCTAFLCLRPSLCLRARQAALCLHKLLLVVLVCAADSRTAAAVVAGAPALSAGSLRARRSALSALFVAAAAGAPCLMGLCARVYRCRSTARLRAPLDW